MQDNLEVFAREVTVAKMAIEQATAARAKSGGQRDQIARRIQALAGERSAITARRGGGDLRPEDGASLEVISADTENLEAMLVEAEAAHAVAAAATGHARQAHAAAEGAYQSEENRLALLKIDQHAATLVNLLAETLAQRRSTASALQPTERMVGNVTNRLEAFDRIICNEMSALLGFRRGPAPHPVQPVWKPSDALHDSVWRLHNADGYFL